MSTVKRKFASIFLEKVESGNVTAQDIYNAQTLLESSVIISSKGVLRKGRQGSHKKTAALNSLLP
ncbi:hypothetical protein ACFSQ7_36470 [Paenibacillus rhizoplanae]